MRAVSTLKEAFSGEFQPRLSRVGFCPRKMGDWSVHFIGAVGCLSGLLSACEPKLTIGNWACPQAISSERTDAAVALSRESFVLPWSTGFEDGFCDYAVVGGYCYSAGLATFEIVSAPVHSGQRAAAFKVIADDSLTNYQARCVREGTLPTAAYYGAWYFIPFANTSTSLWNLIHFQGATSSSGTFEGTWDISMVNKEGGGLRLSVYDFVNAETPDTTNAPAIPIGSWFHLEVYLKRAADASGEITVFQDGATVLHLSGLSTDKSQWGQVYIGNFALYLEPDESTLYVDDVTISATR
jgi:hypothetical protein